MDSSYVALAVQISGFGVMVWRIFFLNHSSICHDNNILLDEKLSKLLFIIILRPLLTKAIIMYVHPLND